eukprot:8903135-Alexandrium_andersonii.AAC.1
MHSVRGSFRGSPVARARGRHRHDPTAAVLLTPGLPQRRCAESMTCGAQDLIHHHRHQWDQSPHGQLAVVM